jgi:ribulose-5-phosphate 4-epimerase/fuculose-1-phosphate aldolase
MSDYYGVKFTTKIISRDVPADRRIEELKYWCQVFHDHNLAPAYKDGSYGNLSFRLQNNEDRFIITGSRIGLKNKLTGDSFVTVSACNLKGRVVYIHGTREPSSETMLHFAIYHQRKDVNAIFHGHSPEVLSHAGKLKIPQTKKEEAYGTTELIQRVLEILDDEPFVVMKNHGFISLGRSMKEAGETALQIYKRCLS